MLRHLIEILPLMNKYHNIGFLKDTQKNILSFSTEKKHLIKGCVMKVTFFVS